jgi:hypothetical protein
MAKQTRFTIPQIASSPDPTIKARVRQAMLDDDAKPRKIFADKITPETKEATTEISEQLKNQSDDPPAEVSAPTQPQPQQAPPTKHGRGQPPVEIEGLDETLAALDKKRPDPRLRVTKADINFVFDDLDKRGVKLDREEKESTIRRRVADHRQALLKRTGQF